MVYPRIIGLSGKIGTGKSTLTKMFTIDHPEYTRLAFADLVKEEASSLFRFPLEWCYTESGKAKIVNPVNNTLDHIIFYLEYYFKKDPKLPRKNMTVREVLQWYGTDYIRNTIDPQYWIKAMNRKINATPWVIIDDVRFPDELQFLRDIGGLTVRINPYPTWTPGKYASHRSEIALDDHDHLFDLVINPDYNKLDQSLLKLEKHIIDMNIMG